MVYVGNDPYTQQRYKYSVWYRTHIWATNKPNLKMLLKLKAIVGKVYMQSEECRWYCHLEHDKLYKEFVDKKK